MFIWLLLFVGGALLFSSLRVISSYVYPKSSLVLWNNDTLVLYTYIGIGIMLAVLILIDNRITVDAVSQMFIAWLLGLVILSSVSFLLKKKE